MIGEVHQTSTPTNLAAAVGALKEARDVLRDFESTALAAVAESLAHTAKSLATTAEYLEASRPADWMDHEEAARYLRTTPAALHKIAQRGEVPRHNLTEKRYLYSRAELDAFLLDR